MAIQQQFGGSMEQELQALKEALLHLDHNATHQ